jgi:hypothetical protein
MHSLTPYKVILTIFFLFAWTRVFNRYYRGRTHLLSLLIWTVIWGGGLYLIYVPNKADFTARLLGASNGANAVFTITIIVLYYSVYRIYSKIEELTNELNKLNQAASIAHAKLEREKRKPRR